MSRYRLRIAHPPFARRLGAWRKPLAVAACLGVITVQWIVIAHRRARHIGDFDVVREFGRRFLTGEDLYAGGLAYPYMPAAAMYFSPLALVEPAVGLVLRYAVAIVSLWLTLRWLHGMVRDRGAAVAENGFTIAALTILLASHYVIRDLDDGGPHLILLAMLVGGMSLVRKGRVTLGGMCFGLVAALKPPAALFVPFFVCKRQWRVAVASGMAAVVWIVLPAVWMGVPAWWAHQRQWTRAALGSMVGDRIPGAETSELRVQNQALRPAIVRYLATDPDGHAHRSPRLGQISPSRVNPVTAEHAATVAMLGVLAACGWWARSRYRSRADPRWPMECSAVFLLALLCSPVTWVQHLVWMIPALYLIVAEEYAGRRPHTPTRIVMLVYVACALVLNRELLGRDRYLLLLSYQMHTFCMLLILGVVLGRRPTAREPSSCGR